MMRFVIAALVAALLWSGAAVARTVPTADFFRDPAFTSVSLSPTGEYVTVSVPQGDRTVLAALRVSDMQIVGKWDYGARRHIDRVLWVNNERFLMFVSLKLGSYDFRVGRPDVYATNVDGTQRRDMPNLGLYQIVDVNWDDPRGILVQRSIDSAFLSRYDVYNGEVRTVATAPVRFGSFILDHERKVRYVIGVNEDQTRVTLRRDGDRWTTVHRWSMAEGGSRVPVGFGGDGKRVYYYISDAGEPVRLVAVDPESGEETPLAGNEAVDPSGMVWSSDDQLLALRYADGLPSYSFVDRTHPETAVFAGLINAFTDHAVRFGGISRNGRYVLFQTYSDVDPGSYYLFDRETGSAQFLLAARDWIKPEEMSETQAFSITARDGTRVHGYLTIPRGSDGRNLPLILHPHGGPHGPRDDWGFNPTVQFLANRGYAVLQVNFRGSGGYGDAFERAGYKRWGTAMIDDMADAVDWAVAQGVADKDRVCVFGASYGGYAALQSVVRYPDKYRCTIGYVAVTDLGLLYSDGSAETPVLRAFLDNVIPADEGERRQQSPLRNIDRINVPVMMVHGRKDETVPMVHYNRFVEALTAAGKPPEVTIVEDKEAHGFYDLDNNVELFNAVEAFLGRHIGPRAAD
jgi:dipeptidyl aminopeptidase/acylaminoacyl peptidase